MAVLSENGRRLLTLSLFFALGPSLLFFIGHKIFSRNSGDALKSCEESISQLVDLKVRIERREFLRPRAQRLVNVKFLLEDDLEIAVCPEIYIVGERDENFIKKIATLIDSYTERSLTSDQRDSRPRESAADYREEEDLLNNVPDRSLEEVLFSSNDGSTTLGERSNLDYALVIVPTLICREDKLLILKSNFVRQIFSSRRAKNDSSLLIYGLAIDKIIIDNDAEPARERDVIPARKSNKELARYFTNARLKETSSRSVDATEDAIGLFDANLPAISGVKSFFIDAPSSRRFDVVFDVDKITTNDSPYFLSLESFKEKSVVRVKFDSSNSVVPATFLARFFPAMRSFGRGCWFSGKLDFRSFGSENGYINAQAGYRDAKRSTRPSDGQNDDNFPYWIASLENAELFNCNIEKSDFKKTLPQISGTITRLAIETGALRQGIFEGKGSITIDNGALPADVLVGLRNNDRLEARPFNALNYRFPNDEVPFNELDLLFAISKTGLVLDSRFDNKIIACYEKGSVKYGFFLPQETAGKTVPCSRFLRDVLDVRSDDSFWTPLFRQALIHLPIESARTPVGVSEKRDGFVR